MKTTIFFVVLLSIETMLGYDSINFHDWFLGLALGVISAVGLMRWAVDYFDRY